MMTTSMMSMGARLAALALTTTAALALAACEEHPYPSAAPQEATAAPQPDDSTLSGAPTGPGYNSPTTRTPNYAPQAYPAAPDMTQAAPAGSPYGPPQAPGYGPGSPSRYPAQGYPAPRYPATTPEIVTMAPIPNPPERVAVEHSYGWRHHYRHVPATHALHERAPQHHRHRVIYAPSSRSARRHAAAAPLHAHSMASTRARPAAPVVAPAPRPQLAKPQALDRHHHHRRAPDAADVAAASGGASNIAGSTNTIGAASEADRYQALQRNLHDAFVNGAQLSVPAHMEANQPSDVTLTVPADFAQTVRNEAAKQNLSKEAATVNLMASLAGDGYMIIPGEAQSQPLTANTPTTFTWKVTPTGAGRGALKASVRVAVGEGHDLALGDKTTGSGATAGRVVGIGLLALVALVGLGWAAQRRRPKLTGAAKPRSTHTNGNL